MMEGIEIPIPAVRFPLSLTRFTELQESGLRRKLDSAERDLLAMAVEFINYAYASGRSGGEAPEVTPDGRPDTARFYSSLSIWTRAAWLKGRMDAKNDRRAFIRTFGRAPDNDAEVSAWVAELEHKTEATSR